MFHIYILILQSFWPVLLWCLHEPSASIYNFLRHCMSSPQSSPSFGFITNDVFTQAYSQTALAYQYAAAGLLIYLHINVDTKEKSGKKESNNNNSFLLIKNLMQN